MPMVLQFANVLVFLTVGIVFLVFSLALSSLFRPSKYSAEKLTSYECGENPIGSPWIQLNIRFYVFALIFIVFDVQAAFVIPWDVVFNTLGRFPFLDGLMSI